MSGPVHVGIRVNPNGTGKLHLNGVDYSNVVAGFRLEARPGRGASLVLELAEVEVSVDAADVRVEAEGPVDVPAAADGPERCRTCGGVHDLVDGCGP